MNRLVVFRNHRRRYIGSAAATSMLALLFCLSLGALAQITAPPPANADAPFSIRATHLLGLENTKSNCNGTLSIQSNSLQFQQRGKPDAQVNIASVQHIFLGEESKQVGGLPMKFAKTAAPYGGGRVVSLFAHKKYDTLTLEYVDSGGGVHGVIFQLSKGKAQLVKQELMARVASPSYEEDQLSREGSAEVIHEQK